jgi:hypothetical protein
MPHEERQVSQVFISYSWRDDRVPPGRADGLGFIGYFRHWLEYCLSQEGPELLKVWRDREKIEETAQFAAFEKEAGNSNFLIVVLSRNWLKSKNCRSELEAFRRRWAKESNDSLHQRVLVVHKQPTELQERPDLLCGQNGHKFFWFSELKDAGAQEQTYFRATDCDQRFYDEVGKLAKRLYSLARQPAGAQDIPPPPPPQVAPIGRTVFVAEPASDMRRAFDQVVHELKGLGFAVVPGSEIPRDETARAFIDEALAKAECAIHLLGKSPGFVPEGEQDGIVKLQLLCAAQRVGSQPNAADDSAAPMFGRLIWAPGFVVEDAAARDAQPRDPVKALEALTDQKQLDTDKIEGGDITQLKNFLRAYLDRTRPRQPAPGIPLPLGAQVYVHFDERDRKYAESVAVALNRRDLQATMGTPGTVNEQRLRNCKAVALCWAGISEPKAVGAALKLSQKWRRPGRKEGLALLVAPPPNDHKQTHIKIKPPEVDLVLDLTSRYEPSPNDLDPWLGPWPSSPSAGPGAD